MNEKLQKIFEVLEQNAELKKKYYDNPPKTIEEFIAAAKELGFELTEDDLKIPTLELTDEELEQVAGGKRTKEGIKQACGGAIIFFCTLGAGAAYYAHDN